MKTKEFEGDEFSTVGVDRNILGSSIEALEKWLRYFLIKFKNTEI